MIEELNRIINNDCLNVMKQIPDKYFDLCLTDPPYGLGIDGQKKQLCKNIKHNRKQHETRGWDKKIPDLIYFKEINRISKKSIIFGANYFNQFLEQGYKGWIIWDKGQRELTMSDCEIAWTNFNCPTRIFKLNRASLLKDDTFHPTQKPVGLFSMILRDYSKEGDKIFDPFSGSGTTAIACHRGKRQFLCVEKDEVYFQKSVERLEEERKQMTLL